MDIKEKDDKSPQKCPKLVIPEPSVLVTPSRKRPCDSGRKSDHSRKLAIQSVDSSPIGDGSPQYSEGRSKSREVFKEYKLQMNSISYSNADQPNSGCCLQSPLITFCIDNAKKQLSAGSNEGADLVEEEYDREFSRRNVPVHQKYSISSQLQSNSRIIHKF